MNWGTTIPLYDPTISYMAISSNHIQSNSGPLCTVHLAFAAADCSAEGTVSILNRGLDVHGGAAAGGLLLLLGLHRCPKPQGESPKTRIYWENPWRCGCLSWPINLAMSYPSEYQLAKKSFQLGLALLQEPSNTIIYCKTFWPLTTPQSSHSSFLFRINHNNSSTWEVWPFGDDSPYVATWGCDQIYPDLIVTARVISCNMLQSFMCW